LIGFLEKDTRQKQSDENDDVPYYWKTDVRNKNKSGLQSGGVLVRTQQTMKARNKQFLDREKLDTKNASHDLSLLQSVVDHISAFQSFCPVAPGVSD